MHACDIWNIVYIGVHVNPPVDLFMSDIWHSIRISVNFDTFMSDISQVVNIGVYISRNILRTAHIKVVVNLLMR